MTSAVLQFFAPGGPLGGPLDVTEAFAGNIWDGRAVISVPNQAGLGINGVKIRLTMQPGADPNVFADGFETGDTSSWTDQVP